MTNISDGNCQFDITCAVFDKDGTLLDFEQAWGARISPPNSVGTSLLVHYADVILNSIDQLQVVEN